MKNTNGKGEQNSTNYLSWVERPRSNDFVDRQLEAIRQTTPVGRHSKMDMKVRRG